MFVRDYPMPLSNRDLRGRHRRRTTWLATGACLALAIAATSPPARADREGALGDIATEVGLAQRIRSAVSASGLSEQLGVSVVDVRSGRSIFAHNPTLPLDPA